MDREDLLDNVKTNPNIIQADRIDTLYDSAVNDHIMSGGGDDHDSVMTDPAALSGEVKIANVHAADGLLTTAGVGVTGDVIAANDEVFTCAA